MPNMRTGTKHQSANSLYRKYGDHAIIEAIKNGQSFDVLKYLIQKKLCPFVFSQTAAHNEYNDYEETTILSIAEKYAHLHFLRWLTAQYQIGKEELKEIFPAAVRHKHFKIVEWLINKKKICHWDAVIEAINHSNLPLNDKRKLYVAYFNQYPRELLHANHLEKVFQIFTSPFFIEMMSSEKKKNAFKEKYFSFLHQALESTINEKNTYKIILQNYTRIDAEAAFQFHINLFLKNFKYKEINDYCLNIIHRKNKCETLARMTLAELLLINYFEWDETNSPLNNFTLKENHLKRAAQAFYLIKNCESDIAHRLKQRLHQTLSGNTTPYNLGSVSIETWLPHVRYFYLLYVIYKDMTNDSTIQTMIKLEQTHYLAHTQTKLSETTPYSNNKRKQATLELYFFKANKKPKNEAINISSPSILSKYV